jgi:transcriptional regulator with XRE-family HTH domain
MAGKKALSTPQKTAPVTAGDLGYARTATRLMVAGAVWRLWDQLRRDQGLDQQWLADRLGKDKSRVSRLLKGPGNWTMDTVADLLEAMEGRLTLVEATLYRDIAASSPIEPSLAALRESGQLWNVLEVKFEANAPVPARGASLDDTEEDEEGIFIISRSEIGCSSTVRRQINDIAD